MTQRIPGLSIRRTIPLLIVTPLLVTVFLAGLLSYFNSRRAVETLAMKINEKATLAIQEYLLNLLTSPVTQVQTHAAQFTRSAELEDFARLEEFFWNLMQQSQVPTNVYFANPRGHFFGLEKTPNDGIFLKIRDDETAPMRLIYELDEAGRRQDLFRSQAYDPRDRDWYQKGAQLPRNTTAWSDVYVFATAGNLGLTAIQPAYDGTQFLGVMGVDIALNTLQDFLRDLELSDGAEVFIMERDGTLIATTTPDQPLYTETETGETERINILNVESPKLQAIAQKLHEFYGESWQNVAQKEQFTKRVEGTQQFVGVMPLQDGYGIDWVVVVTIPETDFQSIIFRNTQSTLIIGSIIAIAGSVVGLLVARWIVEPIDRLNTAAIAIESQKFQPMILDRTTQRADELGQLATVFQRMGVVISANQASLEEQKTMLEAQVAQAQRQQSAKAGYTLDRIQDLLARSRNLRQEESPVLPTHSLGNGRKGSYEISVAELLRHVPYFETLPPADIDHLLAVGEQRLIPAGVTIFTEGAAGETFYIVLSGRVNIRVDALDKFLAQVQAGGFFGELSLLLGLPRTATARTLEPTQVFVLDQTGLRYLMQRDAEFADRIADAIHHHQAELESREDWLREHGLLRAGEDLTQNPLQWIRQRLQALFGLAPPG